MDSKNTGSSSSSSGGIGFCGLLTIVFVALKLTGYIGWSWWWVAAPMWMPALTLTVCAALAIIAALVEEDGLTERQ